MLLYSIRAASEAEAGELLNRLRAGEQFPTLAATASRDEATRGLGGYVGKLRRSEMSAGIADAVFATATGSIVGPLPTDKGCNLFLVADRRVPPFEEEAHGIRLLLFRDLLTRLRVAADIRYPLLAG